MEGTQVIYSQNVDWLKYFEHFQIPLIEFYSLSKLDGDIYDEIFGSAEVEVNEETVDGLLSALGGNREDISGMFLSDGEWETRGKTRKRMVFVVTDDDEVMERNEREDISNEEEETSDAKEKDVDGNYFEGDLYYCIAE